MNILLDLIIIAIAGITVWRAAKRGFVKTLISAVGSLLALLAVVLFTAPLADALAQTSVSDAVRESTASFLEEMLQNSEAGGSPDFLPDADSELYTALEAVGIDPEELSDRHSENAGQADSAVLASLADYIAEPAVTLVTKALAMLILFFGTSIVLKLVGGLLSGVIEHLPFVRQANRLLGVVLGIVLALVRVFVFCAIADILITTASLTGLSFFAGFDPAKTCLFRLFDTIQILQFLF